MWYTEISNLIIFLVCFRKIPRNLLVVVDGQLNAKLADLELGTDSRIEQAEDESPFQKDFLANWIPPEVSPLPPFDNFPCAPHSTGSPR
jgi:hypothetical protein